MKNIFSNKLSIILTLGMLISLFNINLFAQKFTMTQTLSDGAQRTTIAFDGLAFFTGSLGADSFFPPGKVADFWGFQYLRDNDPSEMGHNTDFLTKAAYNMLTTLDQTQFNKLKELAKKQVESINKYGYDRFVLMKAFRRLLEGNTPSGKPILSKEAVKNYSAQLYILDGTISYERAKVMGGILKSLTDVQKNYLNGLKGKGMLEWPTLTEPEGLKGLVKDEKVAVMTYGGDLFSWYVGSLDADIYFCPERQGTYFGSFYMKDAPAVGNPNYTIGSNITADYGNAFLNTLNTEESQKVKDLVTIQNPSLLEIVDRRTDVSKLLRNFITGGTADSLTVINLMKRYGELDGEIVYNFAKCFAEVYSKTTQDQMTKLFTYRKEILGDFTPKGAYLYATEITIPQIPDTDFLFESITENEEENIPSVFELKQNYPNPFNPETTIDFSLPSDCRVLVKVYNIIGQQVAVIIDKELERGNHKINFNASNISSGIYFYKIEAVSLNNGERFIRTKKMTVIK